MRKNQRGVTFIGWLFLLTPVAIVAYAGIRLAPMYLNYSRVSQSMEQTAQESRADDSAQNIRFGLEKRLDINGVYFPDSKDFAIRRDGASWVMEITYEESAPMIAQVSLTTKFTKSVRMGKAPE
jgi:hypothetical protein